MSLQNPATKMSKSHSDPRSQIFITDDADTIRTKFKAALTDSTNSVSYDPVNRPGVANLIEILSIFDEQGRTAGEVAQELEGQKLIELKTRVGEAVVRELEPVRDRYKRLAGEDQSSYIDDVLRKGTEAASRSARETMDLVRSAIGL